MIALQFFWAYASEPFAFTLCEPFRRDAARGETRERSGAPSTPGRLGYLAAFEWIIEQSSPL
ncbi:MAG: hypothetical protein LUO89_12015 [Methanothrix sp.]|nr:hypothetical protein [Methanothrix sp.]